MTERDHDTQWHLDKKVPLALIGTIVMQTIMVTWWAANASARLEAVEKKVEAAAPQAERIVRLEEKIGVVQQGINELKAMLMRPTQPAGPAIR